jgi:hypothetical protein
MDRFFIRDFSAFMQEGSCGNGFLIKLRERTMPQAPRGRHDSPAAVGYSPFGGARYFGNQLVGVKATQDSADLGALAFWIMGEIS